VSRAYGNRGNARTRQGRVEEALADYNDAIRLAPLSPDPVLNRYVCAPSFCTNLQVGRAYGNRGNARTRQGKIEEALADYNEAIRLSPWSPNPVLNRYGFTSSLEQFGLAARHVV
jgi:tetratricopeptide (TPR) repeat protein